MRSILGIETPGLLIKWLFYEGFPNAVEGGIAGYLPILTAKAICGPYSLMTAAYATATLYAGVFIALMALGFAAAGFHSGIVAATFQLLGVLAGLFVAAQEFDETPPTPGAQKAPSL